MDPWRSSRLKLKDDLTAGNHRVPKRQRRIGTKASREGSKLSGIIQMPLDVLFEIFGRLLPLDLLNLARSTKRLRSMLVSRSASFVWKDALANYPSALPPYADGLSEVKFTHLLFDHYCDYCGSPHGQDVHWAYFLRLCDRCTKATFLKVNIAHPLYAENIVPYSRLLHATGWGCHFACKSEIAAVAARGSKLKGDKLARYMKERSVFTKARLQFDSLGVLWLQDRERMERETAERGQQRREQ